MGFPEYRVKKALLLNMVQVDLATNWLLDHNLDPKVDDPLTETELDQITNNIEEYLDDMYNKGGENAKTENNAVDIDNCVRNNICTYSITGKKYVRQTWFHCFTCGLVDNIGCCESCSKVCHEGHILSQPQTQGGFYCDCGESGGCKCVKVVNTTNTSNTNQQNQ